MEQGIDIDAFGRMWTRGTSLEKMSERFGLKPDTIRKYARQKFGMPRRNMVNRAILERKTAAIAFLRKNYPETSAEVCATLLGLSPGYVRLLARKNGIKHSAQYIKDDYNYRAKKISQTRKEAHIPSTGIRNRETGRFMRSS